MNTCTLPSTIMTKHNSDFFLLKDKLASSQPTSSNLQQLSTEILEAAIVDPLSRFPQLANSPTAISHLPSSNCELRCTTSDLNNCHSTNSGIRAQESQKFEEQRQKPNLPRIQSAQNRILSTPECSTRRKECTGENFTQIGATERPHAPPEVGEYRHAPPTRSQSTGASPPRASHLPRPNCRIRPEVRPEVQSPGPTRRSTPCPDPTRIANPVRQPDVTNAVITAGIFRQVKEYSVISIDFCQKFDRRFRTFPNSFFDKLRLVSKVLDHSGRNRPLRFCKFRLQISVLSTSSLDGQRKRASYHPEAHQRQL
ncbi:hypothetical protein LWI29_004237 [Acer saccharum]|uniref:Uncharacterized protein n=1 Tax=Acer saccharum TaxID=4024 RepID=A0AA39TI01_ACESA|nr:hypothetical protein LWI29_004237 [Acer saccharum]